MSDDVQFGRVSSVFMDAAKNDVYLNVVTNPNREPREVKLATPQTGFWMVPREGDIVEVHAVGTARIARYPRNPPPFDLPTDLSEGDVCLRLNQDTELHFSLQDDGSVDVELTADGDISVASTGGDITIDGIDFDQHVHDYDDGTIADTGDGSGSQSDTTRTTSGPNNP